MIALIAALVLGQGKFDDLFQTPPPPAAPSVQADWPAQPLPRSLGTPWPVRVMTASMRAPETPRTPPRPTYDIPENVWAPQPAVRTVALQQPAPDPHAAVEPSSMPVPVGVRHPAPVAHEVSCICCGDHCACSIPGQCGHEGCACGHKLVNVAVKAAPPAAACCPTCGRCYDTPAPLAVQSVPKQWIELTNEPGVRGLGRIVNGYAVDIERRELIPTYTAPIQYSAPPTYFAQPYGGFGSALGGSCAGGSCGTQSRGGLFGGLLR